MYSQCECQQESSVSSTDEVTMQTAYYMGYTLLLDYFNPITTGLELPSKDENGMDITYLSYVRCPNAKWIVIPDTVLRVDEGGIYSPVMLYVYVPKNASHYIRNNSFNGCSEDLTICFEAEELPEYFDTTDSICGGMSNRFKAFEFGVSKEEFMKKVEEL